MAKFSKYANVYTGLFVGAVSGWLLRKHLAKDTAKTTVVGTGKHLIRPSKPPIRSAYPSHPAGYGWDADVSISGTDLPYKNPVANKYDEGWNDGLNGQSSFDVGTAGSYSKGYGDAQAWKQAQGLPLP